MFMSNFQIETLLSLSDGENSSEGESSSGEREFFEREGKRKRGKKELRNFDDLENIEVTSDPEEAWKILKDSERVEFFISFLFFSISLFSISLFSISLFSISLFSVSLFSVSFFQSLFFQPGLKKVGEFSGK